jgi:hypothetical protein
MLSVLERPYDTPVNTSVFVIESNIPIPPRAGGKGSPSRYPFALMQVGDSFEVPLSACRSKRPTMARLQSSVSNAATLFTKAHNKHAKFSVRKTSPTTFRVWRVA